MSSPCSSISPSNANAINAANALPTTTEQNNAVINTDKKISSAAIKTIVQQSATKPAPDNTKSDAQALTRFMKIMWPKLPEDHDNNSQNGSSTPNQQNGISVPALSDEEIERRILLLDK